MSFGYGVGDVITVLGLFERIAIELRNYQDAPTHFQQLRAELDLLRGTLKRILSLEPECDAEREILAQIRAIVIYCAQPLQSMADKMRSKESSLGHFRTTRSLVSIGTRLHWSMIDQTDVKGLRKILLSQMAAINTLLSVQQLASIRRLALQSQAAGAAQSTMIEKHANAMAGHASTILSITSRTQSAIDNLVLSSSIQAQIHSKQTNKINESLQAMERNMHHMTLKSEQSTAVVSHQTTLITRHAKTLYQLMQDIKRRMLLDIRLQLKHIISAIEAIPLHLTLDIVRLDDVHGESWALPLQACRTWESFKEILQFVVYPNERPGAKYITNDLFAVAQAKTGKEVNQETWEIMIKPGFHLEQAVVLKMNYWLERCLDPKCNGTLVDQVLEYEKRQVCNVCSRSAKTEFVKTRVVDLYNEAPYSHHPVERFASLTGTKRNFGTELPPIDMDERIEAFRRVKFLHPTHPLSNEKGCYDPKLNPAVAHAFSGLATLSPVEGVYYENPVEDAREHLETSVKLDSSIPENWYLLSRACMMAEDYERAYQCLQTAISLESCCPSFWITLGILYFNIGQSRDCLDALTKAVELNAHIWEPWYNLGVLYDSCNGQHSDAADAFYKCLERNPELSNVRARLEAHQAYTEDMNDELLGGTLIYEMVDSPLDGNCGW
ncbi:hypothetical protein FMUND_2947 [Fusarium mundagurra]|uniref:Ubiquitin-like domain-containing protein n=1 Tax=Fusarium mundagurra TaxID=1567541 RepID=A0A8H5Z0E0_9HYPO|nr:hypothetical protein FMUND_2947 [Fusarium mundagurra]